MINFLIKIKKKNKNNEFTFIRLTDDNRPTAHLIFNLIIIHAIRQFNSFLRKCRKKKNVFLCCFQLQKYKKQIIKERILFQFLPQKDPKNGLSE